MPTRHTRHEESPPSPSTGSLTRFILRGSAVVVAARLVIVVAGLGIQVILARLFAPEELGAYFLTQSVVTTVAIFAQAGLVRPLTRNLASLVGRNQLPEAKGVLLVALRVSLIPIAGISALYALGAGSWLASAAFSSPTMAAASLTAAGWLAGIACQGLGAAAIRGFHDVGAAAFLEGALTNVVVVGFLSVIVWSGSSAEFAEVVWLTAIATWLNVGLCVVLLGRRVRGVASRSAVTGRQLLAAAIPLIGVQAAAIGFTEADLWLVGGLLSEQEVALYGAAKRVARIVGLPLMALTLVLAPIIADLHSRGEQARLQRVLRGSATLAAIPAALVALPCFFASDSILSLVFGSYFAEAGLLLQLICVEPLAAVAVGPTVLVLAMTGHERDVLLITLIGGVLSVAAIYVAGRFAGVTGIAAAYAVTGTLRELLSWWVVRHRLGVRTDVDLLHLGAMRDAVTRALQR